MSLGKAVRAIAIVCVLGIVASAQQPTMLQTPRQAVIEMMSGGDAGLMKHLTLEVQNKFTHAPQDSTLMSAIAMARASGLLQSFESGPVLFMIDNPQQNEKIEVRVDSDSLRGDIDNMELSFHAFRDGKEESLPVGFHMALNLKQQMELWRLNAVTVSVRMPVGDPKFFDGPLFNPSMMARARSLGPDPAAGSSDTAVKIAPLRAVRLIGLAENLYAQKHPDAGFTCNMADLVNIGKGIDEGESYSFVDPEFAKGVYNGYRFTLRGCGNQPAAAYEITAEPLNGKGKAFCSDATRSLRSSNDGSGATCLATGKMATK